MNCEDLRGHYELYAIGLAEEPERSEIGDHLARGCEVCMTEMKHARELASLLGTSVPLSQPSPNLRKRILASVGSPQRGFWWAPVWAAVAAFCFVAAVYFSGRERESMTEVLRNREQMREQSLELTRLNEAFAILNGPDTAVVSFGEGRTQPPRGRVFVNPSQGVLLTASNLPPAPAGKTYEMWVIPKTGNPVPAGLFQSNADGAAIYVRQGTVDINTTGAIAVTLENAGGADQPTSQPLIVAAIPSRQPSAQ
jgi:anti-sigma-K factor RskA